MFRWKYRNHRLIKTQSSIRELVFGLEDGIVSTGGAVIGIAAGTGDDRIVILSGTVIVIVEALSMAAGTFLSAKSMRQLLERRIRDEQAEIESRPEQEIKELQQIYRDRGFTDDEIKLLVKRVTTNKDVWLEEMTCKELGIGSGQLVKTRGAPAVMWIAYTLGGFVPIAPFIFLPINQAMLTAFCLSLIGLFAIGFWKAKVTQTSQLRGGLEMTIVAASAGVAGYLIGRLVGILTGIQIT
ncbi:VIT1/CCC1 transporter family protein [Patescibacteria group bacterium]|nr:VIT1/CCC1 transporter family protein [Patescibacteria group bacterium]